MRISVTLLLILIIVGIEATGQDKWIRAPFTPEEEVCYGSGRVEKGFVPPPAEILNRLKSGDEKTCNIIVTYSSFPDSVKQAFEYAVGIWEQLLESEVPIYISASWKKLTDGNTLASCGPGGFYRNQNNMYFTDRYYAVAAAEKISGKQITGPDSPDITATFNKDVEWYFGTDGNCPSNRYDFVSTVLHELAHGLGFVGFFSVSGSTASYDNPPAIFDQYLSNVSKQFLIDESIFNNPSVSLYKAVTNNALYFRSPASIFNNNGTIPKLYAPVSFNEGSSIYHLNESSYPGGSINSLMTYAAGYGEATHNPGPIALGIMADIGWKNMKIDHSPIKDMESVPEPVVVRANIESDYLVDTTAVYVYFSRNNFITRDSVRLIPEQNQALFTAILPVQGITGEIGYYISVTDEKKRVFTNPANGPGNHYTFKIGPDNTKPTIEHQPVKFIIDSSRVLTLAAFADDNIGIDSVWAEYFLNSEPLLTAGLKNDSASEYSADIPVTRFILSAGDIVSYRILARDVSSGANIAVYPADGYIRVKVEESFAALNSYSNTFKTQANDFISDDFEVKTASGFPDAALHSPHPYASPEADDQFFNFSALLRYPIILAENGAMNYDEIVLVEPGEDGSVFGSDDFFDYVIVEGSKNFGKTWLPLTDGYDSRSNLTWKTEYNNGVDANGNSQTTGTKEMYVRKNLNMTANGNFAAGDTIYIRFRLYSDPYAHGWGWAIDNLRIQSIVSANEISLSPGDFRVYPNPATEKVAIEYNSSPMFKNVLLSVYDNFGKQVYSEIIPRLEKGTTANIQVAGYPSGLYFVRMECEGTQLLARKIVKQ